MAKKLKLTKPIPTKLSDLENDLFYAKAEETLTLTKEDFVPKYWLDDEGNPTEDIECYYYKGASTLDWFTSPDKIGFIIQFSEDGETMNINHRVPNVTTEWDDDGFTNSAYIDEENGLFPFIWCDECGTGIYSGFNVLNQDELVPEDAFYIITNWCDGEGPGFDSITIYKLDTKLIPEGLYDHSRHNECINDLYNLIDDTSYVANNAQTAANNAQTAANNAQTAANNAQTAANNAQTAADNKASKLSTSIPYSDFTIEEALAMDVGGQYHASDNGKTFNNNFTSGDVMTLSIGAYVNSVPTTRTATLIAISSYQATGILYWYNTNETSAVAVFAVMLSNAATATGTSKLTLVRLA